MFWWRVRADSSAWRLSKGSSLRVGMLSAFPGASRSCRAVAASNLSRWTCATRALRVKPCLRSTVSDARRGRRSRLICQYCEVHSRERRRVGEDRRQVRPCEWRSPGVRRTGRSTRGFCICIWRAGRSGSVREHHQASQSGLQCGRRYPGCILRRAPVFHRQEALAACTAQQTTALGQR
jgi:hypothetical protein